MTPQCKAVLDFMRRRGSITPRQASHFLGVDRLAARIYDLRHDPKVKWEIVGDWKKIKTRYGDGKVKRYRLKR